MKCISYDEMFELASLGAKVLQIRSVEFAKRYQVPVHIRSSFSNDEGTWLVEEDPSMEEVVVSGVTSDLNQVKITLLHVPDRPGLAAKLFAPIANENIVIDMIIQNASADGFTDLTFTVPKDDAQKALACVEAVAAEIHAGGVTFDPAIAKVSLVGLGMRSHAGVAARMFQTLACEDINIQMIATSEIKISVVIDEQSRDRAVRALHDAFISSAR
jgi:aspartate kinase